MSSLSRLPFTCRFLLAVYLLGAVATTEAQSDYEPYFFGRLAGNAPGSDDGAGPAARFFDLEGVTVDAAGNAYVADYVNSTIRKITPAGVVTTVAGLAWNPGSIDGPGAAARFKNPTGVAVDAAGNLYVADFGNDTIRKITPGGVVSTVAGSADLYGEGSSDGVGTAARFYQPAGVAVDTTGHVYVADFSNHTIRKITPAGMVTTLAGLAGNGGCVDGTGSAARFAFPNSVAVDTQGNVYVADTRSHAIRKITPSGVVTTLAGLAATPGSADGTGSAARFAYPFGVAVDAQDNVYVAEAENSTIRKITAEGVVTTLAGSPGNHGSNDGTGTSARFYSPRSLVVDSAGNVHVADSGNNTIRKMTPTGVVTTRAGVPGGENGGSADGTGSAAGFVVPSAVAIDTEGNAYVADTWNHTVRKITGAGVVTTLAGLAGNRGSADGTGSTARFDIPQGVAVDRAGNVYVADSNSATIRKINPAGVVSTLAGTAGNRGNVDGIGSAARFQYPTGMAVDPAGNIYVADTFNDSIRRITPGAVVTTFAGASGSGAYFSHPQGVAVDSAGNVYVPSNAMIRKITPDGLIMGFAGSLNAPGSADGTGAAARFSSLDGVAVDNTGNVYVTDGGVIRKITAAGVATTLAGSLGTTGNASGIGTAARFWGPQGIATDPAGHVYVADRYNHTIRIGHAVAPAPQMANISTRLAVGSGDNALIGGFIITGSQATKIILRAIGPSLAQSGVPGALADPTLEFRDASGALLASNDDWNSTQVGGILNTPNSYEIQLSGFAPSHQKESAIIVTLSPGAYTAVVRGKNNSTGVALVETYDLDWGVDAKLANISTRGFVQTGDNVLIGGTILRGSASATVLLRAIGPSLANVGVANALQDPTLELHDGNGALMIFNDNWRDSQQAEIQARGLAPSNDLESAILATLPPGACTAIVRGFDNTTGIALVEAYELGD